LLLFLAVALCASAKDKSPSIDITVVSTSGSNMIVMSDRFSYAISCQHWNCYSLNPGTRLTAREGSTWGVRWLELTWLHDGKSKSLKYTVENKSLR
jgi:hypothetical protein